MKFSIRHMKAKVHALIFYQSPIGEITDCLYKYFNFKRESFSGNKFKSKSNLEHYLLKQYHIIEKGLTLPDVRLGFGLVKISELLKYATQYLGLYGSDYLTRAISSTLQEYLKYNELNNFILDVTFKNAILEFLDEEVDNGTGGVLKITKDDVVKKIATDKFGFITSRHSYREFSGKVNNDELISEAINAAKYAPSVCNRQGWRVHYLKNKDIISKVLSKQNGTTGFSDQIEDLLIITAKLEAFTNYESYQAYTDAGLFSMNLMLALNSLSIATCPLNACFPFVIENEVKRIVNIQNNERIVMFIAMGQMKDVSKVAISNRKEIGDILTTYEN